MTVDRELEAEVLADLAEIAPVAPPTQAEIEAMVEEWTRRHDAEIRLIDECWAAKAAPTGPAPF